MTIHSLLFVVFQTPGADPHTLIDQYWVVLRVLGTLRCWTYVNSMLAYGLWLIITRDTNPTLYQFILDHVDALNEERGESSFALLSSSVIKDTQKIKADRLHEHYLLLPKVSEVASELRAGENAVP